MSGITPILDTLLHQVLGKRVDVPVARQTPEPVRPLSPAEAPPAVRSDSRLEPRTAPLPDLPATHQRARAPQTLAPPADPAHDPAASAHRTSRPAVRGEDDVAGRSSRLRQGGSEGAGR